MSDAVSISPLLDEFAIGNPISEHHGIRSCPAIKENTDKKYIVKIISIPASQVQMDALLLAGAYKDPSEAMDYFREKGEEVLQEAELLKKLSKLEGFLSYEDWQMEPITRHRLGYEIYLLSSYKRSLERYMRHNAITHLEAINLGLDMCNALSVCRQAGALYVDLKPSNIFMSEKKEYRIGDLGFLQTDTLRYASLPEKYHSSYTPPELYDPMAAVNMTVDTYALGMILYQLYNDGTLPFKGMAPQEGLPSPVHADYELAEIIMKAIHPEPEQRYTDPADMGKALAAYMQRNSINDVAITPLRTKKVKKNQSAELPEVQDAAFEPIAEDAPSDLASGIDAQSDAEPADVETPENVQESFDGSVSESAVEEEIHPADPVDIAENSQEITDTQDDISTAENTPAMPAVEPEADLSESESTEPSESYEEETDTEEPLSEELTHIFAKADDLLAHETPEGVHIPEIPAAPDPFAFARDDEDWDDSDIPYEPLMESEEEPEHTHKHKRNEHKFADPKYKRRRRKFFSALITLLILGILVFCGYWYYQNLYLQPVHTLTITGSSSRIAVQVDTPAEHDQLRVTCADNYGNTYTKSLHNGTAEFTDLQSNTMYTIRVETEGFHKLTGNTSDIFTTDATTNIVSFSSVAGSEDGSVMLSFTVDGDEPEHWAVTYSAEGEETVRDTFKGHSVTVSGLSLGKKYTFTLDAGDQLTLGGNTTLELTASRLILAENLCVTSSGGSDMTVTWNSPGDVIVDSWDIRCYNDMGYDQTQTVTGTEAKFIDTDPAQEYIIEVTAAGMTQPARTGITANPINVLSFTADDSDPEILSVNWDYSGNAPEGGWLLLYSIDGSENYVIKCTDTSAKITPKIPGAKYVFSLQSASGVTLFNSSHTHTTPEAAPFEANKLTADMLTIDLLKTPDHDNWYCENVAADQLTDQFQSGDRISLALRSSDSFYLPGSRVSVLFVIRDSYGNVLSNTRQEELVWKNIWTGGDSKNGELDIPSVPETPGNYVLDLYFDGMHVTQKNFTVS